MGCFRAVEQMQANGQAVALKADLAAACATLCPPTLRFRRSCPNEEQLAVIRHVAERVQQEWLEERAGAVETSSEDPLFELVHGLPGTGKSAVINWMREIMERGLQWKEDLQFVMLAFQNTAAHLIGGRTIHSWAGIDCRNPGSFSSGMTAHMFYIRCQCLRVIVIDEISMVPADLLG